MLLNNNIQLNRNINLIMKIFLKQNNIITFAYFYNLSYINLYSLSISSYYTIYTRFIKIKVCKIHKNLIHIEFSIIYTNTMELARVTSPAKHFSLLRGCKSVDPPLARTRLLDFVNRGRSTAIARTRRNFRRAKEKART